MALTKQEQDVEAINQKLDAVLNHLGLQIDTQRGARVEAEAKAVDYWAVGGEGWLSIHGKQDDAQKAQDEALKQAEQEQAAIVAVEEQRQAELAEAARLAAEESLEAAQASADAQQEALAQQNKAAAQQAKEAAQSERAAQANVQATNKGGSQNGHK